MGGVVKTFILLKSNSHIKISPIYLSDVCATYLSLLIHQFVYSNTEPTKVVALGGTNVSTVPPIKEVIL